MRMKLKHSVGIFFVAAILLAELFGPLSAGVRAAGSAYTYVQVTWVTKLTEQVCVGDEMDVGFIASVQTYKQTPKGITPMPPGSGKVTGNLNASAVLGSLSKSTWVLRKFSGIDSYWAKYTAEEPGDEAIEITGAGFDVNAGGATLGPFQVEKCQWRIAIGASKYVDDPHVSMDTSFQGEGKFSVDDAGVVYGEGTYTYNLTITYIPPDPDMQCEKLVRSLNSSTFAVSGTAGKTNIHINIKFKPIDLKSASVHCIDREGKHIDVTLFQGAKNVDINSQLGIQGINFDPKASGARSTFPYGDGWGIIWVTKRKAK
jgi:hypothetical protein